MKTRQILPFVLALFCFSAQACIQTVTPQQVRRSKALYRLGVQQSNQGMLRQALAVLVQAEQANPEDYWIQEALGVNLMRMNQPKRAIKHFHKALEITPKSPRGWNNLGTAHMALKDWKKAIGAFQKALKNLLYQTPCHAEMNLGWSYQQNKQPKEALLYLRRAVNHCPRFCQAYRLLGKAYFEQNNYKHAEESFSSLVKLCRKYPEGHYWSARTSLKRRKYPDAVRSLRRCMELSERNPSLRKVCEKLFRKAQTKVARYVP